MFRRHVTLLFAATVIRTSAAKGHAGTATNQEKMNLNGPTLQVLVGQTYYPGDFPWGVPLPPPLPTPFATGEAVQGKNKPVLVLDLDNTLIYFDSEYDVSKKVAGVKTDLQLFKMVLRPHLKEFLTEVMQLFEVVFWTAAVPWYAAAVIDGIERHVLGLPRSIYHHEERKKRALFNEAQHKLQETKGIKSSTTAAVAAKSLQENGTTHVNFYCLHRGQTMGAMWTKYLPLLGRPLHRTVLIDDSVRHFPLTPRNGILVPPFDDVPSFLFDGTHRESSAEKSTWIPPADYKSADDTTPQWPNLYEEGLYTFSIRPEYAHKVQANDTALLDLLPLLRALAATKNEDITRELDHWRKPDYVRYDDFSNVHLMFPGTVTKTRQASPIPPLQAHPENAKLEEEARAAMDGILKAYAPPPPPPPADLPSPPISLASSDKKLKHKKAAKKPKAK